MMEGIQYGGGISSVRWRVSVQISMEDAHHQYGGGYTVLICHIINTERVCRTGVPKVQRSCYCG